jgi:sugar phosphate isomerase/epimerase
MTKIQACATLGFASFPLEFALEKIVAMGFSSVEITHLGAYCLHLPMETTDPNRIVDLLQQHSLTTKALNVSTSRMVGGRIERLQLADPSKTEATLTYTTWYIQLAKRLGAHCVSFPIGPRILDETTWKEAADASCAVFRQIVAIGADHGIKVNLEIPHLFQLTDTVEHTAYVFDAINHDNLGATVDTSHWGIIGYDLDRLFSYLGEKLVNIHLRDSQGADTKDFKQDLELTPGDGTVDFAAFRLALERHRYQGNVTLELEHRHDNIDHIDNAFRSSLEHLKTCGWQI